MGRRRRYLALVALSAVGWVVACAPGAYPIDFFSEMHYQASQRREEPRRLAPPPDAVPVTGARVPRSFPESASLQDPMPPSFENLSHARTLYAVNCAACHGRAGDGQGIVASYFRTAGFVPPVAFNTDRVRNRSDGELAWLITYGIGNMPAFGNLLSEQDVWRLVLAIREFEGR